MSKTLTPTQSKVLAACVRYFRAHNYPPTIREIMRACDLHSESHVRMTLRAIEQRGLLIISPGEARAMNLAPTLQALAAGTLHLDGLHEK